MNSPISSQFLQLWWRVVYDEERQLIVRSKWEWLSTSIVTCLLSSVHPSLFTFYSAISKRQWLLRITLGISYFGWIIGQKDAESMDCPSIQTLYYTQINMFWLQNITADKSYTFIQFVWKSIHKIMKLWNCFKFFFLKF